MNVCNIIRDLMPLYHDSAISADSRQAIREHLKTCPQCQRFYRELQRDRRHALPTPPAPEPDAGYAALVARMRADAHRRTQLRMLTAGTCLLLNGVTLASVTLAMLHRNSKN